MGIEATVDAVVVIAPELVKTGLLLGLWLDKPLINVRVEWERKVFFSHSSNRANKLHDLEMLPLGRHKRALGRRHVAYGLLHFDARVVLNSRRVWVYVRLRKQTRL